MKAQDPGRCAFQEGPILSTGEANLALLVGRKCGQSPVAPGQGQGFPIEVDSK